MKSFPQTLLGSEMPNLNIAAVRAASTASVTDAGAILTGVHNKFGMTPPPLQPSIEEDLTTLYHDPAKLNLYYFHPDHLGSSSYITNASGVVTQHIEYMAFGEVFVEEHSNSFNSPFKFNGKELDGETGNYYYGARYYDPKLSTFISVDPLAEKTGDAYGYCYNNPVKFIDPDGNAPKDIIYFNSRGQITKVVKDGSSNITMVAANGQKYTPSTLDSKNRGHLQMMANVGAHYRTEMGIDGKYKVAAGPSPTMTASVENPAFTSRKTKQLILNSNGGFSETLDNLNNLKSVVKHENLHQIQFEKGFGINLSNHADVYLGQMSDPSFKNTTDDFKISMAGSFATYLLNMDREGYGKNEIIDKIEYFNTLDTGLLISNPGNYSKGELNLKVYHDNNTYAVPYKKVDY